MSKATKQWLRLTEERLGRLVGQGTHPGAQSAWEECRRIREAGGRPVAFYSEFNGFSVFDEYDRDAEKIKRLVSIEGRSREFPG